MPPINMEEAKKIMRRLGPEEQKLVVSISAPLYWELPRQSERYANSSERYRFFLKTAKATFGVTAAHVIDGRDSWRAHCEEYGPTPLRLAGTRGNSIELPFDARCVDMNLEIDIATFMIPEWEIASINRTVYTGYRQTWPPPPPERDKGILYAGFPAAGTRTPQRNEVVFGAVVGSGIAHSINERDVMSRMERKHPEPTLGDGMPPPNYHFGGMSGGPMLYVVETPSGLRLNALAGVIYSGPSTSADPNESFPGFELFYARRARFIREDGFLEHDLWDAVR